MPDVEVVVGRSSGSVTVVPPNGGSVTVVTGGSTAGGGAATPQRVYVQDSEPDFEGVGLWVQTYPTSDDFQIWFEDGDVL